MAENGRKDVFRARSGEKPTGHREREKKRDGNGRRGEEICIADIAVRVESAMAGGAKNGSKREAKGALFMRSILTSGRCIPPIFSFNPHYRIQV